MTHYYCDGGCEGVSDKPGTCQAVSCKKHGAALIACDCDDQKHNQGTTTEEHLK